MGCVPTAPAAAVQLSLPEHRWSLLAALRHGLEFEQWMVEQGDPSYSSGAKQRRKAQRRVGLLKRFVAAAGLADDLSADDEG